MKSIHKITAFLIFALLISISSASLAQAPPPPPPGSGHGLAGPQSGSGTPIGDGIFLLLGLAGLYGGKKMHHLSLAKSEKQ